MTRAPAWRAVLLMVAGVVLGGSGEEPPAGAEPSARVNRERADDPISTLEGSEAAWSVSDTPVGCYAMSAYRHGSSRLAIGQHPTIGRGVFVIGLGLATSGIDAPEPVTIELEAATLRKAGRMAAATLLFVPLTPAEEEATLHTLEHDGALWIAVRATGLSHGGAKVAAALAQYRRTCVRPG